MTNIPFLFWKDPREKNIFTILNPEVSKIKEPDISEEGFLLFPFQRNEAGFKFKGSITQVAKLDIQFQMIHPNQTAHSNPPDSYKTLVNQAIDKIEKGFMQKVVLARSSTQGLDASFDISHYFEDLCILHPNALVYCLSLDQDIWIGATPEIYIQKQNETYITHALAGTVEQSFKIPFGAKEIEEHDLVKNYIVDVLTKNKVSHLKVSNSTELITGKLKHLINEIRFCSPDILKIIKELHPTPAVCGTPFQESYDYIIRHENLNREFYSGFLGPIYNPQNFSFWVNLRCAKICNPLITFFAGAGIVRNSKANDEWQETEHKMNALRECL